MKTKKLILHSCSQSFRLLRVPIRFIFFLIKISKQKVFNKSITHSTCNQDMYPYLSIDHLKMGIIRSGKTNLTPEDDDALTDELWLAQSF